MNIASAKELHHQIEVAIEKINANKKPKILTWNGERIVLTPIDGLRAARLIGQWNCLGVYGVDATSEQILDDLCVVIEEMKR
ncbi:hypothetical protein [Collimonas fungivorans]|uniref:hypothetical protein n=1 Tax=Collimonas fungivorans TaxID=158899 RepID=UPI0002F61C58|nr:hypothetical protein [Collimonas fungivorans]